MDSKLVRLKSFDSALAADAARVALAHHGVQACLDGGLTGTALNHIGSALAGVGLIVAEEDAPRAVEIMAQLAREADWNKAPWYCGRCREEVEATFDICWSCGQDRREVEIQRPPDSVSPPIEDERIDGYDEYGYKISATGAKHGKVLNGDEWESGDPEIEDLVARAWRASIIGIVFLPVILHLYSMWLLLRASTGERMYTAESSRKFYQAFAINIIAGCAWSVAFLWMMQ